MTARSVVFDFGGGGFPGIWQYPILSPFMVLEWRFLGVLDLSIVRHKCLIANDPISGLLTF